MLSTERSELGGDAPGPERPSTAERVRSGIAWSSLSRATQVAAQLVGVAVLARLLAASDYGVVNMSAVFLNLANALGDFGIRAYIVQKREVLEQDRDAALLLGWALGAAVFVVSLAAAIPLSRFYSEPRLAPVLVVQSLMYLFANAASVHLASLTRALRFRRLALAEITSNVVYVLTACLLALAGAGYWSLVAGRVIASFASLALVIPSWQAFLPRLTRFKHLLGMMRFGGTITASGLLGQLDENFDNIVVGRSLGTSALGLYAVSYNTAVLPQKYVAFAVAGIANPVLARTEPGTSLADACVHYVRYQVLVAAGAAVGVGIFSEEVCSILLGQRWPGAPALVSVMSASAAFLSVCTVIGGILVSRGHAADVLRYQVIKLTITAALVLVGMRWGLRGVAFGFAGAAGCGMILGLPWAAVRAGLGGTTLIRAALAPASALVTGATAAWLAKVALLGAGARHSLLLLAAGALAFIAGMAPIVMWLMPEERRQIGETLRSHLRRT